MSCAQKRLYRADILRDARLRANRNEPDYFLLADHAAGTV